MRSLRVINLRLKLNLRIFYCFVLICCLIYYCDCMCLLSSKKMKKEAIVKALTSIRNWSNNLLQYVEEIEFPVADEDEKEALQSLAGLIFKKASEVNVGLGKTEKIQREPPRGPVKPQEEVPAQPTEEDSQKVQKLKEKLEKVLKEKQIYAKQNLSLISKVEKLRSNLNHLEGLQRDSASKQDEIISEYKEQVMALKISEEQQKEKEEKIEVLKRKVKVLKDAFRHLKQEFSEKSEELDRKENLVEELEARIKDLKGEAPEA